MTSPPAFLVLSSSGVAQAQPATEEDAIPLVLASFLAELGQSPETSVDLEDSPHELASALQHLARALSLPVPEGRLITGQIDKSGKVVGQPDLLSRIEGALADSPTDLVAGVVLPDHRPPGGLSPAEHLERSLQTAQSRPSVIGVRSLQDAAERLFALRSRAREGSLIKPTTERSWYIERLFRVALEGPEPGIGWPLFAACCIGLLGQTPDPLARWKLAFARDIARRHQGDTALLPCPTDAQLDAFPRETQAWLLAHVVQSAADSDLYVVEEILAQAQDFLPARPRHPCEARLEGAIGRALAAIGDDAQAHVHLEQAIEVWARLEDWRELSMPLCEQLRLLGQQGPAGSTTLPLDLVRQFLASNEQDPDGCAFVRLAAGRALAQQEQPAAALAYLGEPASQPAAPDQELRPVDWEVAPEHAQASRLRWRAACERATGQPARADLSLDELARLGDTDQLHLARLDRALSLGLPVDEHLTALLACQDGPEATRLLGRLAPGQPPRAAIANIPLLRRLLAEYRY